MSPAELSALRAYQDHDRHHPGAVAWLEGQSGASGRQAVNSLTASGHLERGLFGLRRISRKGRVELFKRDGAGR